jgi:hypothetical protein
MMESLSLQQIIRQRISLPARPNGHGFYGVLCKVCNDHGKKGKRAGFKFTGEAVGYNCFNCGHSAGYDPHKHETMPKDMVTVLDAFGIPDTDWQQVLFRGLELRQTAGFGEKHDIHHNIEPDEIHFPPYFYRLTDDPSDDFAQYAIEYLTSRKVNWKEYPFYLVHKVEHPDNERWYGRLIIPTYKGNKLVFWQGRDLTDLHVKKYLSPSVPRENILTGYDELDRYTDEPLYIVEGWFDAFHLKGVAVYGNKMTQNQITWINRSNRPKVVIPDRIGDGYLLAKQALDLGWAVSTPDIGSCKDVNDAIVKYGELYTRKSILQHTSTDRFAAEAQLGVYCEFQPPRSKNTDKTARKT